jgi:hypothetical protein
MNATTSALMGELLLASAHEREAIWERQFRAEQEAHAETQRQLDEALAREERARRRLEWLLGT